MKAKLYILPIAMILGTIIGISVGSNHASALGAEK